jgi:preprotein translocase subunit SecY
MKFLEAVANVFRVPDLRKRLLFVLALLAVYRLGGHIPTPGIDTYRLEEFFQGQQGTLFGLDRKSVV